MRNKKGLAPSPGIFPEDNVQNRQSLEKLRNVDFARVADGHAGLTVDGREQLLKALK